jgi:hypothetical protein
VDAAGGLEEEPAAASGGALDSEVAAFSEKMLVRWGFL